MPWEKVAGDSFRGSWVHAAPKPGALACLAALFAGRGLLREESRSEHKQQGVMGYE